MGSAIGNMGTVKFERESKTPGVVRAHFTYIAKMAGAIAAITGDPQLQQIGDKLAQMQAVVKQPKGAQPVIPPPEV